MRSSCAAMLQLQTHVSFVLCLFVAGWFAPEERWLTDEEMTTRLAPDELPGPPPVKLRRVEEPNMSEALTSSNPHVPGGDRVSQSPANENDDGWEATDSWEDDEEPLLLLEDDSDDDSTFMRAQCNSLHIISPPHTCRLRLFVCLLRRADASSQGERAPIAPGQLLSDGDDRRSLSSSSQSSHDPPALTPAPAPPIPLMGSPSLPIDDHRPPGLVTVGEVVSTDGSRLLKPPYQVPDGPYKEWWRFFLFLRSWTLIFNISTRASEMLYKIIALMLPKMLLQGKISNHIVDKTLGLDAAHDNFIGYVCCPKCHSCTKFNDSHEPGVDLELDVDTERKRFAEEKKAREQKGAARSKHTKDYVDIMQVVPKLCTGKLLRKHTQIQYRECRQPLVRIIGPPRKRVAVPFLTYAYRPVKTRLCELLNRPGFEDLCERWRSRGVPPGYLGDVYDGSVWRDFQSVDGKPFLSTKNNYALSIFVDWFQPWKRVQYSVGVLFACILNLPREERHKKENIFLIGVFPGGTEKNLNLQHLLVPFVQCMLELHPSGGANDHPQGASRLQRLGCRVSRRL